MGWKMGLLLGATMLGVGEAIPDAGQVGPIAQLGAVGVLAATCWRLFVLIDRIFTSQMERWAEWEKVRHDDHERLNETLTQLRENCAAVALSRNQHKENVGP